METERGGFLVLATGILMALLALAAVSVDAGWLFINSRSLQSAVDLAALAAAQELPENPAAAQAAAIAYLQRNGIPDAEIESIRFAAEDRQIEVRARRTVPLLLGRLVGDAAVTLRAEATATALAVSEAAGVVPWGHEVETFVYGAEYALKWGAGDPDGPQHRGNYHIIDVAGGMTPQQYTEWVANGYWAQSVVVGQEIQTRPGNLGNATERGVSRRIARAAGYNCNLPDLDPDCPLIVVVPVVDSFVDVNGRGEVRVKGFARFLITRLQPEDSGNHTVYGIYLAHLEQLPASDNAGHFGMKRLFLTR